MSIKKKHYMEMESYGFCVICLFKPKTPVKLRAPINVPGVDDDDVGVRLLPKSLIGTFPLHDFAQTLELKTERIFNPADTGPSTTKNLSELKGYLCAGCCLLALKLTDSWRDIKEVIGIFTPLLEELVGKMRRNTAEGEGGKVLFKDAMSGTPDDVAEYHLVKRFRKEAYVRFQLFLDKLKDGHYSSVDVAHPTVPESDPPTEPNREFKQRIELISKSFCVLCLRKFGGIPRLPSSNTLNLLKLSQYFGFNLLNVSKGTEEIVDVTGELCPACAIITGKLTDWPTPAPKFIEDTYQEMLLAAQLIHGKILKTDQEAKDVKRFRQALCLCQNSLQLKGERNHGLVTRFRNEVFQECAKSFNTAGPSSPCSSNASISIVYDGSKNPRRCPDPRKEGKLKKKKTDQGTSFHKKKKKCGKTAQSSSNDAGGGDEESEESIEDGLSARFLKTL